jgi:hypothetical protein
VAGATAAGAWAKASVRAVALILLLGLAGCGGDPTPGPTTSSDQPGPTAPSDPPPAVLNLFLSDSWQPAAGTCKNGEQQLAQPPEFASLVIACRPTSSSGYIRILNQSDTTLVLTVGSNVSVETLYPAGEKDLTQAALGLVSSGNVPAWGGYYKDSGELYLPARFQAVITDNGQLGTITTRADPNHGRLVTQTRAVTDLADQLPYAKLANLKSTSAKVAACVLESAQKLNDDKLTLKEAIDAAKSCRSMIQELRDWWDNQRAAEVAAGKVPRAGLPQTTDDLLRSMSKGSEPAGGLLEDIARQSGRWVARVHRIP